MPSVTSLCLYVIAGFNKLMTILKRLDSELLVMDVSLCTDASLTMTALPVSRSVARLDAASKLPVILHLPRHLSSAN